MKHPYVSENTGNTYRSKLKVHKGVIVRGNPVIIPKVLQSEMLTRIYGSQLEAEACLGKGIHLIYCSQGTEAFSL